MTLSALPAIPPQVVNPDHLPALALTVLLPFALAAALFVTATLATRGGAGAAAVLHRLAAAGPAVRVLALLLLLDGAIHAGLVPGHLDGEAFLAALFALDAVVLLVMAAWVVRLPGWHLPALALLLANVFIYAYVVDAGWEAMDGVGAACKLLELAALALVTIDAARHSTRPAADLRQG